MKSISMQELITEKKVQYVVYAGIGVAVTGLTAIGNFGGIPLFKRLLGGINPLIIIPLVILSGVALLSFLLSTRWFSIFRKEKLKGLFRRSGVAALFGLVTILVDLKAVFPSDWNVLFPTSLTFYPVMGFIVEILFHVLPLVLFLILLTSIFKNIDGDRIIWISIFIVSLIEPVFQTVLGFSRPYPVWTSAIIGTNIFLINLSQLIIFKRDDFVSMYSFRIAYYLIVHIAWGYARLQLLPVA